MHEQLADDDHGYDLDRNRPPSPAGSSSEATVVPWKPWSLSMDQGIDCQDEDVDSQDQDVYSQDQDVYSQDQEFDSGAQDVNSQVQDVDRRDEKPSLLTVDRPDRLVSVRLSDGSSLGSPHPDYARTRTISGKSMATTATSRTSWQTHSSEGYREERAKLEDVLRFAPVEFDSHLKLPSSWDPKRGSRASRASKMSKASRMSKASKMSKFSRMSRATSNSYNSRSDSPAFMTAEDFGNGSSIYHRHHQSGSSFYSNATSANTNYYTDARPHSPDSSYHDDLGSYLSESESTQELELPEQPGMTEEEGVAEVSPTYDSEPVPYDGEEIPHAPHDGEEVSHAPHGGEEVSHAPHSGEEVSHAPHSGEEPFDAPRNGEEVPQPISHEPLNDPSTEGAMSEGKAVTLRRESTTRSVLERMALRHIMSNKPLPPRPPSMPGRPPSMPGRPPSVPDGPPGMPGPPQGTRPRPKSMALSRPSTKSYSKSEKSLQSNALTQPSIASVTMTYSKYRPQYGFGANESFTWDYSESEHSDNDLPPVRFWIVFIAMNLNLAMFTLDQFMVTVAAPRIAAHFNALDQIAWLNIAFFIPCTAALLLYTQVLSIFPPRYVYIVALVVFLIGSAVSGSATSMAGLFVGRAISGLGGAGVWNTTFMIAADVMPANRSRLFDILGMSYVFASVLGPLIGGGLTDLGASWGWRWCFYIYLPICGVTLLALVVFLPNTPYITPFNCQEDTRPRWKRALTIDYLSFALTIVSLVCFCLALQWGGVTRSWDDPSVIVALVFASVLFCALAGWSWYRGPKAMIPLSLLRSVHFNGAIWVAFFAYSLVVVILFYLSVFFQSALGTSATRAGVLLLAIQFPVIPMLILAGKFSERTGYAKGPIVVGSIVVAITAGIMSTYKSTTSLATVVGLEVLAGVGLGLILNLVVVLMQAKYHGSPHLTPHATNVFNFWGFVGRVVGLAIATTIFENKLHHTVGHSVLRQDTKASLLRSPLAMWDNDLLLEQQNRRFVQEAYADAIHNVWWVCLAMALACGYAAMAMRNLDLDNIFSGSHTTGAAASSGGSVYATPRTSRANFEKEDSRSLIRYSAPPGSILLSKPTSQRTSQRSSIQYSSAQRSSAQRSSVQRSSIQRSSIQRSSLRSAPRNASPPPPVPPLPDMASLAPASAGTNGSARSALPWGQQATTPRASPVPRSPAPRSPVPPSSFPPSFPPSSFPASPAPPSPANASPVPPSSAAPSPVPSSRRSYPFPDVPEPAYMTPKILSSSELGEETPSAADSSMALPNVRSFTPLDTNQILAMHEPLRDRTPSIQATERLRVSDRYPDSSPAVSMERSSSEPVQQPGTGRAETESSDQGSERPSLEGRVLPSIPTPTPPPESPKASIPSPTVAGPRPSLSAGRSVSGPRPIGGPRPLPRGPAPKTPLPPTPDQRKAQRMAQIRAGNMI